MNTRRIASHFSKIALQVVFSFILTCLAGSYAAAADPRGSRAQAINAYGKLPLSFEANHGQTDQQVKFLSRGPGYALFLTPTEAVLTLKAQNEHHIEKASVLPVTFEPKQSASKAAVLRIRLDHANGDAKVSGIEQLPGKSNYFIGKDPTKWRRDIPTFAKVKYQDVYPGVDLVYYGNQRQLEYDFVLAPGADPRQIELSFNGAEQLRLDGEGNLVVSIAGRKIIEHAPFIYQDVDGERRRVAGGYELASDHRVGFKLTVYDHRKTLTIDPSLAYSTYLGGSSGGLDFGQGTDQGNGIAVDSSGNAYVTGFTQSSDFPVTSGALQTTSAGFADAFVSKLNSDGSALIYSTYLGGTGRDQGQRIAVDSSGSAYIVGSTESNDFPTTAGALQTTFGGGDDAFVSKLNSSGSALIYSTYLGGSDIDLGRGLAVDSSGNAYLTGATLSSNFPITSGALQTTFVGFGDAFVSKLNSSGSALIYSTYLGGSISQFGYGVAVDSSGNAYVAGVTMSVDFPIVAGALQTTLGGGDDVFVSKLNSSGSALVYSTYLGGSDEDFGFDIAVDSSGNAYVTGQTVSSNFPTTVGALQPAFGGGNHDTFVSKLNSSGSALIYSTYLGGSGDDSGSSIAADPLGNAYVTGETVSIDFPISSGALQPTPAGGFDAFVSKLNSGGSALLFSTYLGGSDGSEIGTGIALDSSRDAFVAGTTGSSDFPTTKGALQTMYAGVLDAFVSKISFCLQPKSINDCKHNGWKSFCEPSFKNQGQCVAFVSRHSSPTSFSHRDR